ncbi:VOC family protein [Arthrobacter agilis]|uniref:VOC family protein n=1 Tax=Arthrobacter agilis TaxID=37921 RepID=UPI000B352B78|nr:VOC family protein [Arthrobacter agilis]OUM43685.1 hypothetical protein B8W74_05905 [Arthrobacter agilis]PPB46728.1 VOC family protein [Arthrobacter agilis]TPV24930.1 VOC family protein [Arthrobacter agilis]VDR31099.1 Glyoxalase-like domain [Arthrobacter agilis]
MLRVRPLVYPSDLAASARFLTALGLRPAAEPERDSSFAVFDAGNGRVALQAGVPGSTGKGVSTLAFEVADVPEFARRTREAGTGVELSGDAQHRSALISAPDGTTFSAAAGPRDTGVPPSPLSVLVLWRTPDVAAAAKILEDIGAQPRLSAADASRHDFRAKNGGLVVVRPGGQATVELAFEYGSDVRDLVPALADGGFGPAVVDTGDGWSLRVASPWGTEVEIAERRGDVDGAGH